MATLNVFTNDAFSANTLTQAIERQDYLPSGIGALGLFEEQPIYTTAIWLESRDDGLALIPTSERGSPPVQQKTPGRKAIALKTLRLAIADTIYASELQDMRAFDSDGELRQVQDEVAYRLSGPGKMMDKLEYTRELHRMGALSGILLDADGSTIYNFFTEFGITQPAEIAFDLTNTTPGALRAKCDALTRSIARASKGAYLDGFTQVMALVGDSFWDKLVANVDWRSSFLNQPEAGMLRDGTAWGSIYYGGIYWKNYRGSDDNATLAIGATKAKFFLRNAPGIFKCALAPAEFMPFVNTRGKREYVIPSIDAQRDGNPAWWRMELFSYPLFYCARPETLFSGREGT